MRILAGLVVAVLTAGAAWATPPGVTEKQGSFVSPEGLPLYTFVNDRTAGKSSCMGGCADSWPPLVAAAGAQDDGDWTIVTRTDGRMQWAYKGKPLYTYKSDTPNHPASGVGKAWTLVVK